MAFRPLCCSKKIKLLMNESDSDSLAAIKTDNLLTIPKNGERIMKIGFQIVLIFGFLFLTALGLDIASALPPCPPGTHLDARLGECVPNPPACPPGSFWDAPLRKCVSKKPACPPGTHWDGRLLECVSNLPACPGATHWSPRWNRCVPN